MKKEITPPNQKKLDNLAIYLKTLRLCEGLNQTDIEGFHHNTISRIENAKNFTLVTLFDLADFYCVKPLELLSMIELNAN